MDTGRVEKKKARAVDNPGGIEDQCAIQLGRNVQIIYSRPERQASLVLHGEGKAMSDSPTLVTFLVLLTLCAGSWLIILMLVSRP